jgi:C1A family cysteine protease
MPGPNDADVDYHAVIAVGLGETAEGEQCLLVRNSWGPSWGLKGHAWITVPYLAQRLRGTLLMSPKESLS